MTSPAPVHRRFDEDDPTGFYKPDGDRRIKDIIHDEIPIHSYLSRFIDTEVFQRLREIKQLGTSSYVWPNATHTRFEHCLGVAFLARTLASHLQTEQPELKITNRDIACVEIAGLCHDLGHGPWSHVWDGIFMPAARPDSDWKHEQGSDMMFDYMVKTSKIPIPQKDQDFIKALIGGVPEDCDASEKKFLFDIVANKRNGLDVDKFDYIQRDSRMTGQDCSFPAMRILRSAKVLDNQICYNIKDANQIYKICHCRFELHKLVYNHKTARAIEYMIVDALLLADPIMKIADRVYEPEKFLRLNDHIMIEMEMSSNPALQPSRDLLKRIRIRDLYRCVDYKNLDISTGKAVREYVTSSRIFDKIQSLRLARHTSGVQREEEDTSNLKPEDIIVDITTMHHGMKEHNPVDFVKFYSKLNTTPQKAGPGDYSELRPLNHAEMLLRIFTKKSDMKYLSVVQEAYRAVMNDFDSQTGEEEFQPIAIGLAAVDGQFTPERSPCMGPGRSLPTVPVTPGSDGPGAATTARKFKKVGSQNYFTSYPSPGASRKTTPFGTSVCDTGLGLSSASVSAPSSRKGSLVAVGAVAPGPLTGTTMSVQMVVDATVLPSTVEPSSSGVGMHANGKGSSTSVDVEDMELSTFDAATRLPLVDLFEDGLQAVGSGVVGGKRGRENESENGAWGGNVGAGAGGLLPALEGYPSAKRRREVGK